MRCLIMPLEAMAAATTSTATGVAGEGRIYEGTGTPRFV